MCVLVAAALLLPPDSPLLNIEAGIQLEGPEALSFFEVADIMKKVSGKNVRGLGSTARLQIVALETTWALESTATSSSKL